MDKTLIRILNTQVSHDGMEAVYAELPNGTTAWLAVHKNCELTGFETEVNLKCLVMDTETAVKKPLYKNTMTKTVEYFHPQEDIYFAHVCGRILRFEPEKDCDTYTRIELACEDLVLDLFIANEFPAVKDLEIGSYLETEVLPYIDTGDYREP